MTRELDGTLCIIPARGGSKRVTRKNLREVAGKPLLQHAVEIVIRSGIASRIVVSTDDDEIADVARRAGADVPFARPVALADDHTPTAPVVAHAISALRAQGADYLYTVVVYPTAILLDVDDLRAGRRAVVEGGANLAFSVCRYPAPLERAWRMRADGRGEMRQPEHALTRTQDLEPAFYDAGQFYFGTSAFWELDGLVSEADPVLIELPPWRAVDIDTEEDLAFVERLVAAGVAGEHSIGLG